MWGKHDEAEIRRKMLVDATVAETLQMLQVELSDGDRSIVGRVAEAAAYAAVERVVADMRAQVELIQAFHELRIDMANLCQPRVVFIGGKLDG